MGQGICGPWCGHNPLTCMELRNRVSMQRPSSVTTVGRAVPPAHPLGRGRSWATAHAISIPHNKRMSSLVAKIPSHRGVSVAGRCACGEKKTLRRPLLPSAPPRAPSARPPALVAAGRAPPDPSLSEPDRAIDGSHGRQPVERARLPGPGATLPPRLPVLLRGPSRFRANARQSRCRLGSQRSGAGGEALRPRASPRDVGKDGLTGRGRGRVRACERARLPEPGATLPPRLPVLLRGPSRFRANARQSRRPSEAQSSPSQGWSLPTSRTRPWLPQLRWHARRRLRRRTPQSSPLWSARNVGCGIEMPPWVPAERRRRRSTPSAGQPPKRGQR